MSPLMTYTADDVSVTLDVDLDGVYVLSWSDGVANDWTETFPSLSVAVARLAALIRCRELGWAVGFAHTVETFRASADQFLHSETAQSFR